MPSIWEHGALVAKNPALGHVPSLSIQTLYNICIYTYGGNNKGKIHMSLSAAEW